MIDHSQTHLKILTKQERKVPIIKEFVMEKSEWKFVQIFESGPAQN